MRLTGSCGRLAGGDEQLGKMSGGGERIDEPCLGLEARWDMSACMAKQSGPAACVACGPTARVLSCLPTARRLTAGQSMQPCGGPRSDEEGEVRSIELLARRRGGDWTSEVRCSDPPRAAARHLVKASSRAAARGVQRRPPREEGVELPMPALHARQSLGGGQS